MHRFKLYLFLSSVTFAIAAMSPSGLAQSDLEQTYAPQDTILAVNLNIKKLLEQSDSEDEDLKEILDQMQTEGSIDLAEFERILISFGYQSDDDARDPIGERLWVWMQQSKKVDQNQVMESWFGRAEFSEEKIEGEKVFVSDSPSAPSVFFPEEDSLVIAEKSRMTRSIRDADPAKIPNAIRSLESGSEIHLQIDVRELDAEQRSEFFANFDVDDLPPPAKKMVDELEQFEIKVTPTESVPVLIRARMKSEDAAKQLKGLADMGIAALPGALDSLETMLSGGGVPPEAERTVKETLELLREMGEAAEVSINGNEVFVKVENMGGFPKLPAALLKFSFLAMVGTRAEARPAREAPLVDD